MRGAELIRNAVVAVERATGKDRVVAGIAGAGCLGKTTLSQQLRELVGPSICQVVGLDGYMLEREERDRLGNVTGYDPRGFELSKARAQLRKLIEADRSFTLRQYNRLTHKRDLEQLVEPRKIILIEGGLALRPELYDLEDTHIFLEAGLDTQYILRVQREQAEFGYSEAEVAKRWTRYRRDYQAFIQPQIEVADVVLRVSSTYEISISAGRGGAHQGRRGAGGRCPRRLRR